MANSWYIIHNITLQATAYCLTLTLTLTLTWRTYFGLYLAGDLLTDITSKRCEMGNKKETNDWIIELNDGMNDSMEEWMLSRMNRNQHEQAEEASFLSPVLIIIKADRL